MEVLTALVLGIFYILVLYKCMKLFFRFPRKGHWKYAGWAVLFFCRVLLWLFPILSDLPILILSVLAVFFLVSVSFYGSLMSKAVFSGLIVIIWLAVEIVANILLRTAGLERDGLRIAGAAITETAIFFLTVIGRHVTRQQNREGVSLKYTATLLFVTSVFIYLMHHIFMISGSYSEYRGFAIIGTMLLMGVEYLIFEVYESLSENAEIRRTNRLYEQQLELCRLHAEEKAVQDREICRLRHDMKNHLTGMLGMAKEEGCMRLEAYIRCLLREGKTGTDKEICHSGNIIIDSIVNQKYRESGLERDQFTEEINLPTELPFQPGVLTILFGNLLGNAVDACREVEESSRYIKLIACCEKGVLTLVVTNPYKSERKKDRQGNYRTTKEETGHGFGLESVRMAAQSYGGELLIEDKNHVFSAKVILFVDEK